MNKIYLQTNQIACWNIQSNWHWFQHGLRCIAWWRHQMETFSALLAICAGNSPVTGEVPAQRPATRSFDVFFDLRLNKHFSKQWKRRWFERPSRPFWRHCNGLRSVLFHQSMQAYYVSMCDIELSAEPNTQMIKSIGRKSLYCYHPSINNPTMNVSIPLE